MTDQIIKNPARDNVKIQQPYQPEYKRVGKEPRTMGKTEKLEEPEEFFAGIDNSIIDDRGGEVSIDVNNIIDNNEFVFYDNGFERQKNKSVNTDVPDVGEYVLMVFGKIVMCGDLSTVQKKVKSILYSEDKEFNALSPSIDDIIVLKRVEIRVGVFIND